MIAYLDRINIGFAALTMNKELAISSQQFGMLVGVFFFGYFLFEIPSNLLLHKFGARVWIARILITWGIVAMLTGFVHSVHQLYVARFLLGLAEAGYSPGNYPTSPTPDPRSRTRWPGPTPAWRKNRSVRGARIIACRIKRSCSASVLPGAYGGVLPLVDMFAEMLTCLIFVSYALPYPASPCHRT